MNNNMIKTILVYLLAYLIWGSVWITIKTGFDSLSHIFSSGVRAALVIVIMFYLMKIKLFRNPIIFFRQYLI